MPGHHAKLSPSKAAQWMACPGSIALTHTVGEERPSSVFATQGTAAHMVLERCVNPKYGFEPVHYLGATDRGYTLTPEDIEAVQVAVDWLRAEIAPGDEVECEQKLRYNDLFWGTTDFSRYRPETQELLLADYKHGQGVLVEALGNPQGAAYSVMKVKALHNRGVKTIRFVIIQPRLDHPEGPIREYRMDLVDIMDWEDRFEAAFERVAEAGRTFLDPPGSAWVAEFLQVGKHCFFCPAKAICPAQAAATEDALQDAFLPVANYDPARLAAALRQCEVIEAYARSVREFAYREAERGSQIPGFKLVTKRPTERWRDAEGAAEAFTLLGIPEEQLYERAFLSPAQARARVAMEMPGKTKKARLDAARELLKNYASWTSSGHSLVADDDVRGPVSRDELSDVFAPLMD